MRVDGAADKPAEEQRAISESSVMTTQPVAFPNRTKFNEKL